MRKATTAESADALPLDGYCSHGNSAGDVSLQGPDFVYGNLSVDWCRGSISTAGASVTLLRTELRLLGALLESAGEPVNSRILMQSAWPDAPYELTKRCALRAYVRSLRHRLKLVGLHGKVRTIRGIGYRLVP